MGELVLDEDALARGIIRAVPPAMLHQEPRARPLRSEIVVVHPAERGYRRQSEPPPDPNVPPGIVKDFKVGAGLPEKFRARASESEIQKAVEESKRTREVDLSQIPVKTYTGSKRPAWVVHMGPDYPGQPVPLREVIPTEVRKEGYAVAAKEEELRDIPTKIHGGDTDPEEKAPTSVETQTQPREFPVLIREFLADGEIRTHRSMVRAESSR